MTDGNEPIAPAPVGCGTWPQVQGGAERSLRARELLAVPMLAIDAINAASTNANEPQTPEHPCPCCGGRMIIIETFERGNSPKYRPPPAPAVRIDTS